MTRFFRISLLSALVVALGAGFVSARPTSHESGAWLGVYTQSVDEELAKGFKLSSNTGAIINEVVEDSPADEAGLRENDIVIAVDGTPIKEADQLTEMIRSHQTGDEVTIKVLRDGKEREFKVTLSDRESSREPSVWSFKTPRAPKAPVFEFFPGEPSGAYIGVELASLSDQLRDYFGVTGKGGVLVSSVEGETPAEKAGIKAGDVITKVDGDNVFDASDVRDVVADKAKGDKVELTLVRDRKEMTVAVEVEENQHARLQKKSMRSFALPDIGHIPAPNMPKMKGLWYGTEDQGKLGDDLRDEMKELRSQLDELRRQLEELRTTRK